MKVYSALFLCCSVLAIATLVPGAKGTTGIDTAATSARVTLSEYLRKDGRILKAPRQTSDQDLLQLKQPQFKDVRELLLVGCLVTNAGIASVSHLPLEKLYLTDTKVSDAALDEIAKISTVTQLSLNNTMVTDQGLAKLTKLPIKKLYLNNTSISDGAVQYLKQLPLETLYLLNTTLSDAGMTNLQDLALQALNISGTKVSDASMPILQAFPLRKVYLKGSRISRLEAEKLKLAQVRIDY